MSTSRWAALAMFTIAGCTYYENDGGWDDCGDDPLPCTDPWCFAPDDPDAGTADPDAGTAAGCVSNAECESTEVCAEGVCVSVDDTCRFDLHCGAGRGCVDNECRPLCTSDSDCTAGTACIDARCLPTAECATSDTCEPGEQCVDSRCLVPCSGDVDCGEEELCVLGHCRPNVAPRPFCTSDADCEPGHLCIEGVCRTPCPDGTDDECQRADTSLIRCGASVTGLLLCYTRSETDPECLVAEDCASGERCFDAICH